MGAPGRYPAGVIAVQLLVFVLGLLGAARIVFSAVRTFVVPRGDNDGLSRFAFRTIRRIFSILAPPSRPYEYRDRVMAYYGPVALVLLPAFWLVLLAASFAAMDSFHMPSIEYTCVARS